MALCARKQELTHELSIDASVPRRQRLVDRFLAYHTFPHVANVIHLVPVIQVQATHQREIARALRIDFVFARTGAGPIQWTNARLLALKRSHKLFAEVTRRKGNKIVPVNQTGGSQVRRPSLSGYAPHRTNCLTVFEVGNVGLVLSVPKLLGGL